MVKVDRYEVAVALVRKGHDPEAVRARLGVPAFEWSLMRARSPELDEAIRGRESRLEDEVESALTREAGNSPRAALAYARHVEARKLGEARRRAIEAKLGGGGSERQRAERGPREVIRALTPREFRAFSRMHDKIQGHLPFDADDERIAATYYRRLVEQDGRADAERAPAGGASA